VVLMLLGTTAVIMSTTDMKISANYKTSNQAFYVTEAGIEEARARLKGNAANNPNYITDLDKTNVDWRAYIGVAAKAQGKGYDSTKHGLYQTIQLTSPPLDYTVKIEHRTNGVQVLYCEDSNGRCRRTINPVNPTTGLTNPNIYLVTSYGSDAGANKTIEVEMARLPPITVPAALYVEAQTNILGNAGIFGVDQCGGANLPGIVTTLAADKVDASNNSTITGSTSPTGDPPSVVAGATNMDIQAMIDSQKSSANFAYNVASATHTGSTTPGPGDGWGTPTPGATNASASSCNVKNIVYYNTSNGTNLTDIKLTNSKGCGILLVEGDLDVNGGFSWYGLVIVSGKVKFTGGGGLSRNITGGVLAGGSADGDVDTFGGNTNIVYCSSAIGDQTEDQPLRNLSWMDKI
ncbi:MAG: pilus assembly PilX N-terminal domain-containing protein, partial [Proteobacteria bacterium]|nr:pilus assembly PilX N-terminal domain-containing protein [Pseudomonadota bacterium]